VWSRSPAWNQQNHFRIVDISTWHQSAAVQQSRSQLESGHWPEFCTSCKNVEAQGRTDSMRGNGNQAYADFRNDDITLEIRPGNTCNFACQTCWPEASSRVAQYHSRAGLIDIENLNSNRLDDFEFLLPVADRIKSVVLLGGEPFYDKSCLKFLAWAQQHLTADITMFTNGSVVDFEFLKNYPGKITIVFSLDAVGRPAEYVRYGTVWDEVLQNYQLVKELANVAVRVNITCSVYNYVHIEPLIDFLCQDWPSVVSFGQAKGYLTESSIPLALRPAIIKSLLASIEKIKATPIESGQQANAMNAIAAIVNNLETLEYSSDNHQQLVKFISSMDQVKGIQAADYCDFLGLLESSLVGSRVDTHHGTCSPGMNT
jgi:hypothetical protein